MSNSNVVTFQLKSFWASVLATLLAALCLTLIYGASALRDAVAENTRNAERALAMITVASDERDALRNRMTTVETRLAIWEDRMQRRASDAVWLPELYERPIIESLVLSSALRLPPPNPVPPDQYRLEQRAILPKNMLVTYGSA
tara:strand:- start:549 stop:980 length:432 start_codon:yes stop_codon:yes gene_type:complete